MNLSFRSRRNASEPIGSKLSPNLPKTFSSIASTRRTVRPRYVPPSCRRLLSFLSFAITSNPTPCGGGKLFLKLHRTQKSRLSLQSIRFVHDGGVHRHFRFGCFCALPAATFFVFLFVLFAFAEGEEVVVFFSSALLIIFAAHEFGGAFFFSSIKGGGSTLALFDRPLLKATTGGGWGLALFLSSFALLLDFLRLFLKKKKRKKRDRAQRFAAVRRGSFWCFSLLISPNSSIGVFTFRFVDETREENFERREFSLDLRLCAKKKKKKKRDLENIRRHITLSDPDSSPQFHQR